MNPERGPARGGEVFVLSLVGSAVVISGSFVLGAYIAHVSHLGSNLATLLVITTAMATTLPLSLTMPRLMGALVRRFRRNPPRTRRQWLRRARTRLTSWS